VKQVRAAKSVPVRGRTGLKDGMGYLKSTSTSNRTGLTAGAFPAPRNAFRTFSHWVAERVGSPMAFFVGLFVVVVWSITGPLFHYSDTWQLVINTGTTIVTFLMVFLIQSTQNRDAKAMQLKLDELIRAVTSARNNLVDLENCTDDELARLEKEFKKVRLRAQRSNIEEAPDQTGQ
jgi:low affinity Fe/Cu permease